MTTNKPKPPTLWRTLATLISVTVLAAPLAAAQTTATWTGGGDGTNYSDADNWDILQVPLNDVDTFNVVIPAGYTIHFDVDSSPLDPGQVTDFDLAAGTTFIVDPGHAFVVLDDASIGGIVQTDNSTFLAESAGAVFTGNKSQLSTLGAGQLAIAGTTYASTGLNTNGWTYTLFNVDGAGSLLDLASLQSLNAGFDDGWAGGTYQQILATNSGVLDLSGLQTITGPKRGEDRLSIIINTGATVNLSGLQTISSAGSGTTRFDLDVPTFMLPVLDQAAYVQFELFTDSTWDFPLLTTLDGATLKLWPGATLNMPALLEGNGGTYVVPQTGRSRSITTINAENLTALNGVTFTLGDAGVFNAPALTSFTYCAVDLAAGSTFTTGVLETINNSQLRVSGGVTFGTAYGDVSASTYSSTGLNADGWTYTLFKSSGAGSVLDLSSLQSINAGFNDGWSGGTHQQIVAEGGGLVDLSGVDTITGPNRTEDQLRIIVNAGSDVDLSALHQINSASTGSTVFTIDEPNYALPTLESANRATFNVVPGGTFDLLSLITLDNTTFNMGTASTLNIPSVLSHSGGTIAVPDSGVINAASLASLNNAAIDLGSGGTFNAPSLTSLTGCSVEFTPERTFITGILDNIDNSQFTVSGGETFGTAYGDVAATTYTSTALNTDGWIYTLFKATGAGSVLDLSSLGNIYAGFDDGWSGTTHQQIVAESGGHVDLSGVDTIVGANRSEDQFRINVGAGSSIDLSSLQTTYSVGSGPILFNIDATEFSLPAATDLSRTTFNMAAGTTLNLPALINHSNGTFNVPDDGAINALALTSLNNVTVSFGDGGVFNAPALTSFVRSTVSLMPEYTFTTDTLENIDNSQIHVGGGVTFGTAYGDVAANTYTSTGLNADGTTYTLFKSSGTGSILDLSSLQSLNAGFDDGWSGGTHQHIVAEAGGHIDFSGVDTITSPKRGEDWLRIYLNGGSIDLSSLGLITSAGSGPTLISVNSEGTLQLGNLTVTNLMTMSLADATSTVDVAGSLLLKSSATFTVGSGSQVTLGGNFSFRTTDENKFNAQTGIFQFDGAMPQYLEVGGTDVGFPADEGVLNFGLGQLIVGAEDKTTVVQLMDVIDNGNGGPTTPEALYLYGLGGPDGLLVLGGSTLRLNSINCYAKLDGEWVLLNDLFPEGEVEIPFGDGYIRKDAGSQIVGDVNCDGAIDYDDIDAFVLALSGDAAYYAQYPNCYRLLADIDGDGAADYDDIDPFVALLTMQGGG